MSDDKTSAQDRPADVAVSPPELLGDGFRRYERFRLTLTHADGSTDAQVRDIVRGGKVVGVLPYDAVRDEVVLIRQFRLPAHLATGRGELVEIVAGYVEAGEDPLAAAARECVEETGLAASRLLPLLNFLPTPGVTDEHGFLYLGTVDASALPERAGLAGEAEATFPFALPVDEAIAAVASGACANGYLIIALQWLALNRARLPELLRTATPITLPPAGR